MRISDWSSDVCSSDLGPQGGGPPARARAGTDTSRPRPQPGGRRMMSAAPTVGGHRPVLLKEVLEALAPRDGAIYVDGTFGAGGYSRALLEAADCTVCGIDRDSAAVAHGRDLGKRYAGRLTVVEGCFGDMERLLAGSEEH